MTSAEIYKNARVTNQELMNVLKQLDFKDLSTAARFRFVRENEKSEVVFPRGASDAMVQKIYLAAFAYRLFMQGIIENEGVLKKMVEGNRKMMPTQ